MRLHSPKFFKSTINLFSFFYFCYSRHFVFFVFILIGMVLNAPVTFATSSKTEVSLPVRAVVLEASELREVVQGYFVQLIRLRILEGKFAGQEIEIENPIQTKLPEYRAFNRPLNVGNHVLVQVLGIHSVQDAYIIDYVRDVPLVIYAVLFTFVLMVLGGRKGLRSFLALALGIFVFLGALVPLLASGQPPLATSLLVGGGYAMFALTVLLGTKRDTLGAMIGTWTGLVVAGALSLVFGRWSHLTGASFPESEVFLSAQKALEWGEGIRLSDLLYASILFGSLGAIVDVAVSVVSAMRELASGDPTRRWKDLVQAGWRVGADVIGAMATTLIFAFLSSSFLSLILWERINTPFSLIVNSDVFATDVVRALSGSLGLFMTMPATVVATAFFLRPPTDRQEILSLFKQFTRIPKSRGTTASPQKRSRHSQSKRSKA